MGMKRFCIGIDTSSNKEFSYISLGSMKKINELKDAISHICLRNRIKKIHFNDIDMNDRKVIYPEIVNAVLKSNVGYVVLKHKKPPNFTDKEFYLKFLPEEYSKRFEFLRKKDGIIKIDMHDDFRVSGIENSTDYFLNELINVISEKFADGNGSIFRNDEKYENGRRKIFNCRVICKETGCTLLFNLRKYIGQDSNAITVADMVLGFHQLKFKTKDKILPKTRFDKEFIEKISYKDLTP